MKRIILAGTIMLFSIAAIAQNDTSGIGKKEDTVRVGNFIIIKNNKENNTNSDSIPPNPGNYTIINIPGGREYKEWKNRQSKKNLSTNYFIFDLGFANYNDKTDYTAPQTATFAGQGIGKSELKLITGKSSNVNLWLFMQKLNITHHVLNLKYGLGLSMYNYRYSNNISFYENSPHVQMDSIDFSKNKLYVGYVTIPLMININPSPNRRHGFNISAGVSAGYRIGSHTKQISDERGKYKNHDDFNLKPWLFSYIAEIGLGPVRVYGSYSMNTLFEDAKQYPYTVGVRFSNW